MQQTLAVHHTVLRQTEQSDNSNVSKLHGVRLPEGSLLRRWMLTRRCSDRCKKLKAWGGIDDLSPLRQMQLAAAQQRH